MIKLRDILLLILACGLFIGLMFALAPYLPVNVRDRHLVALQTQAEKGAAPMVTGAIDQTVACVQDVLSRTRGEVTSLVAWDPCVQQGELRLHLAGHDDAIPDFRKRLDPVAAFVQKNLDGSL